MWIFYEPKKGNIVKYAAFCGGINGDGASKSKKIIKYRVAQKECMFLPAISFFGVTSNQKSTFKNLVQLTIWKFPFAKKLQLCHKKC